MKEWAGEWKGERIASQWGVREWEWAGDWERKGVGELRRRNGSGMGGKSASEWSGWSGLWSGPGQGIHLSLREVCDERASLAFVHASQLNRFIVDLRA